MRITSNKAFPNIRSSQSLLKLRSFLNEDTTRFTMKKQRTCFWSTISRAILVLGVISIFSIWLPNKAAAGFCQDKASQLKQSGWDVQSNVSSSSASAYAKCNIIATKTDPNTERTTRAKYDALGDGNDGYNYSTETTYKDGHKTSEEHAVFVGGGTIDHKISDSKTDSSGVKTTVTYNNSGQDVKLTKFDPRLNETTETDAKTGDVTIHTETGKASSTATTTHATGVTSTVTHGEDGTVYTHTTDSTGKIVGATIQKPGGTTEVITGNPDGSSTHVTSDPNGKVISTQSCDKFSVCVNAPANALAKPANLQADKTKISKPTDQSKVGQTGDKSKQMKADVLKQIGDKSSGHAADAKEKMKEGFSKGEFHTDSKIKEKVIPLSQSPSRALEGNKHQPQMHSTDQVKTKSKSHNWSSSAGSQGAAKHHSYKKPRSN